MKSESAYLAAGVILVPITAGVVLLQLFSVSYVAERLWAWYAAPHSLPAVAWSTWLGAVLLKSLLFPNQLAPKSETPGRDIFVRLAAPWVSLLIGWCFK